MTQRFLFLVLFSLVTVAGAHAQTLRLATTEWCPYTCVAQGDNDNIIGRYLNHVFDQLDIQLEIETYPWSRSIVLANNAVVDGLLTAVYSEAPDLLFTTAPVAHYQVCFYTQQEAWNYTQPEDLHDKTLGIIQNYGYTPEIDLYLEQIHNPDRLELVGSTRGASRLLQMLLNDRVDVIVEDRLVLNREAQKYNIDLTDVRNAGCSEAQPFYLALHPQLENAAKIIQQLNDALITPDNLTYLNQLKQGIE
ncbi:MAG: transporter substrate-binding domain-containing protein [Reinekea sp.]|nr:transporter substrate-binding domain-containing protein [Reinekea sp.]